MNSFMPSSRPFLKWAGGKHRVVEELTQIVSKKPPLAIDWNVSSGQRYHEPFLGSGAMFFGLRNNGMIQTQKKPRGQNINSRLRPKSATRPETRLRPKIRSQTGQTNRFREMVVPAAAQLFENATGLASRLLNGRTTAHRTSGSSSTQELRQRSAQNLQEESIESIRNLSERRGGKLPDQEVQLMLAHMKRRNTFVEQEAQEIQELAPVLDEISFDALKDSKTHHAEHAGKAGLPRIDL